MNDKPLVIGLSSCFMHADPERPIFKGKTLLYLEESMAHYLMARKVLVYMIPSFNENTVSAKELVSILDGFVLQGGADVSPLSYNEEPLSEDWLGDKVRDDYEIALVQACLAAGKPIYGICRGIQVLNVALGGTLYQDINTQINGSLNHRNWDIYDRNYHEVEFVKGSRLEQLYKDDPQTTINSVHHQALKDLGKGLVVEARSKKDGIIEAVRLDPKDGQLPWCFAVQWHPEFQIPEETHLLSPWPLLDDFLAAVAEAKSSK